MICGYRSFVVGLRPILVFFAQEIPARPTSFFARAKKEAKKARPFRGTLRGVLKRRTAKGARPQVSARFEQ
jgi:hypothetical protein